MTNKLQGNQENSEAVRVQEPGSPKKYHNFQKDMEIYVSSEIEQKMKQLMVQVSINQCERLFKEISQIKQDLTSTSDRLRVSKEEKCGLEAENLRLKDEVESLQSENSELKNKLVQIKSDVIKVVGPQA